jgi:hypothetical protein
VRNWRRYSEVTSVVVEVVEVVEVVVVEVGARQRSLVMAALQGGTSRGTRLRDNAINKRGS